MHGLIRKTPDEEDHFVEGIQGRKRQRTIQGER